MQSPRMRTVRTVWCILIWSDRTRMVGPYGYTHEALSVVLGNRRTRTFISGEQVNKFYFFRGTREETLFWGNSGTCLKANTRIVGRISQLLGNSD